MNNKSMGNAKEEIKMQNCPHCGAALFGVPDECPRCKHAFTQEEKQRLFYVQKPKAVHQPKTNGLSIAGFIISLVSFFLDYYGLVGLLAAILSGIGRSKAVEEGDNTGLATAGLVLGIIGAVGCLFVQLILPGILINAAGSVLDSLMGF